MLGFSWKQQGTFATAGIILITLVALSFLIKEKEQDRWINLATVVLGISLGWLFGMYVSPYGKGEEQRFGEYATAVSAFVSGYLISKIDGLITKLLSPEQILRPVAGFRLIAGVSTFIVTMLVTYVVRAYA
jgi:hypothetical protein